MTRTRRFAALLTPDRELGGYVAHAEGVVSQGETEQDALAALTEALELYFEDEDEAVSVFVVAAAGREGE